MFFHTFLFSICMWRLIEAKLLSVVEGDSVTLQTQLTDIQRDEQIEWMFGPQDTLIARIYKVFNKVSIFDDVLDGMFKGRLHVDDQTGSLTITNITTQHSGLYEMTISSTTETSYTFSVTVYEVKSMSVMEGDSVTLHTHLTDIQRDEQIEWMFGPHDTLIARNNKVFNKVSIFDDVLDGMFRDRLNVDDQTGSLTITNTKTQHSGLYRMTVSNATETSYTFSVTVYSHLPVPVITRDTSSSVSKCVLLCSAKNVAHVSLSWYKGKSLLSSISVSDLNIGSIPLHLECLDDSYKCVLNDSIKNQTQHLTTDDCQPCSDDINCCDTTEAVIRLVVSALVGVAAVAFLIYDIRSKRAEPRSSPNTLDLEILSVTDGIMTRLEDTPPGDRT